MLPDDAGWDDDADAFTGSGRSCQEYMRWAIIQQQRIVERIAANHDAAVFRSQAHGLDVLCFGKFRCTMRRQHFILLVDEVANGQAKENHAPEPEGVATQDMRDHLHQDRILVPGQMRQWLIDADMAQREVDS